MSTTEDNGPIFVVEGRNEIRLAAPGRYARPTGHDVTQFGALKDATEYALRRGWNSVWLSLWAVDYGLTIPRAVAAPVLRITTTELHPTDAVEARWQISTLAEGLERRAAVIMQLAYDVADANHADCKAGLPVTLNASDRAVIAWLLPHIPPSDTRAVLIECADWVFRSRDSDPVGRELSDSEVEAFVESARAEARDAVLTDTLAAGAA